MSVDVADFHPGIVEALCVHEAFRRLGFQPEDIYIGFNLERILIAAVLNKDTDEKKEFIYEIPVGELAEHEFYTLWPMATVAWNESIASVAIYIWHHSSIKEQGAELVTRLIDKGMYPPPGMRDAMKFDFAFCRSCKWEGLMQTYACPNCQHFVTGHNSETGETSDGKPELDGGRR